MKEFFKKIAFNWLPASTRDKLRLGHYLNKLRSAKATDEKDLALLPLIVREGQTVLDIGANFGLYTKFLSKAVGGQGRVHSFEPILPIFSSLENNVKQLNLNNVSVHHLAISDTEGQVMMEVPAYIIGGDNFYEAHIIEPGSAASGKTFRVMTTTLDQLYKEAGLAPDFIKIDVEGHEYRLLEGGMEMIKKCHPKLLLEINDDPAMKGGNAARVFWLLEELGYWPYYFDEENLKRWHTGDRSINYLFLNNAHIRELESLVNNP
ncbi:MAG: FkbM family methyltransferase [Bacteroidota bacterium]|nr:FkbM family methyltransferase [Bacteroidota bacterium]